MRRAFVVVGIVLTLSCASVPAPPSDLTVVLVPGMTGTKLCERESGRVLWGDTARLITPWDGGYRLIAPLSGAPDQLVPCGPILELRVMGWKKDIYGGLVEFMERSGKNFLVFGYDWRRDNVDSARQLVRWVRGRPGVSLICQSNAAYICRYAVRYGDVSLAEAESGIRRVPENIDRVILVGTANGGALRILRELNRGRQYIRPFGTRFRPETFFTFPALFQDLPAYRRDLFVDADVDLFDAQTWKTYGWSIFEPETAERVAGSDRFGTAEERQAYLERVLADARRLHDLLKRDTGGALPRYYSIQSLDFPTPARAVIRRKDGGWETLFPHDEPGDYHATRESQDWLAREEIAALAEPPTYVPGRHFEMITTDLTRELLLDILSGVRPAL